MTQCATSLTFTFTGTKNQELSSVAVFLSNRPYLNIRSFEGLKMIVRSTVDIDTDVDELFLSYGNDISPPFDWKRLTDLFKLTRKSNHHDSWSFKATIKAYYLSKRVFSEFSDYSVKCIITAWNVMSRPPRDGYDTSANEKVHEMYK